MELEPLKFEVSNASQVFLPVKMLQVPVQQSTSASAGRSFEPQEALSIIISAKEIHTATCMKYLDSGLMIELPSSELPYHPKKALLST